MTIGAQLRDNILAFWYRSTFFAYLLLPFAWMFQLLTYLRRCWYHYIKKQARFNVPIIVVGNITLGGTGKTPLVAFLVDYFKKIGYQPGIVMRGYGGKRSSYEVLSVDEQSTVSVVGDEAFLLAKLCQCPIVVGANRPQAVRHLLKKYNQVNMVISDDGLQHYALGRDVEIAVIDGTRRLGNGHCLPAGPLRESPKRLTQVDFVIVNNGTALANEWQMESALSKIVYSVSQSEKQQSLISFADKTVHAVAGIGSPSRFFEMLEQNGVKVIRHVFDDHYFYHQEDLDFKDGFPILMTQKDAVKCSHFALENAWYVPLCVQLPEDFTQSLLRRIKNG